MEEDNEPTSRKAWASGKLVIIATIAVGPHAGDKIMIITHRADFRHLMRNVVQPSYRITSLLPAIRATIAQSSDDWSPETAQNLMDDLAILMASASAGVAGDREITAAGLFSLLLAVNPDTTQPWNKRGFVNRDDVNKDNFIRTV